MIRIRMFIGQGIEFDGKVHYLQSDDKRIYTEVKVPSIASDFYGYLTMVKAIKERVADLSEYSFCYDGWEYLLARDANVDCDVYVDIDI